jgi:hypothetical protein
MASMFEQPRNGTLFLGGQKISGSDIRDQNGKFAPAELSQLEARGNMLILLQCWLPRRSQMLSRAPSAPAAWTR